MKQRLVASVHEKSDLLMREGGYTNAACSSPCIDEGVLDSPPKCETFSKVSIIPLVFLIFYEVSGGPFGVEDSVKAAGPLLALVGFLVFPLIWSVPEALITAELGTMFPENGGYVVWVASALGPFWGFQQGWVKWLSGVIDNALYPVLFLDYVKSAIPSLADGFPRMAAVLALTVGLTFMNYRGLTIVGWAAILLGVFSLLPFLFMGLVAIPNLEASRWFVVDVNHVDWGLYLNTLFWNLNYWDSISTLAGEVENPSRTLPKALFYALILVVLGYFFPLLIGTGAVQLDRELWTDGYFSDIAEILGGVWLRFWIQGASAVSNMGMFLAEMSSDSFQLLGMADRGMLPEIFGKRSRYGTPLLGILFSSMGVILLSCLSFQEIVAAENFLYCFGMLVEFIAFLKLRIDHPSVSRPYKIPLGTTGAVLMCIPPTLLIFVVLALASYKVMLLSIIALLFGFMLQPCLLYCEKKNWFRFSVSSNLPDGSGYRSINEV
ncbi:OLC1v1003525C1 [Oldenlandia corymbosa var. corymbosa]|uniref:OLC1v1003525C1 n=1 Tax=Oldenlandia corymbosa var. corymbosa TaxID=529605 RepID=A0AAV1DD02_OLDCO|nr:OLC1v1003525C1 [Oldenlandia corymbosa var. corymbosa]